MSCPTDCCPHKRINSMLVTTSGRDLLLGVAQFLPGVLTPLAVKTGNTELVKSLASLSTMAGGYRSVTRLSNFYTIVTKKSFQTPGESFHSVVRFLSWLCGVLFLPLENIAVLTQHGVVNRGVAAARKAELGPRCVYFWFYSLAFEHVHHALSLAKLQSASAEERATKTKAIVKKWLQCTLWFVMAWASMPATGTVQLLSNPTQSLLRPLHLFVEMTTVNGISVGPFTQAACGLAATALQIDGVLEEERNNSEAAKQK